MIQKVLRVEAPFVKDHTDTLYRSSELVNKQENPHPGHSLIRIFHGHRTSDCQSRRLRYSRRTLPQNPDASSEQCQRCSRRIGYGSFPMGVAFSTDWSNVGDLLGVPLQPWNQHLVRVYDPAQPIRAIRRVKMAWRYLRFGSVYHWSWYHH